MSKLFSIKDWIIIFSRLSLNRWGSRCLPNSSSVLPFLMNIISRNNTSKKLSFKPSINISIILINCITNDLDRWKTRWILINFIKKIITLKHQMRSFMINNIKKALLICERLGIKRNNRIKLKITRIRKFNTTTSLSLMKRLTNVLSSNPKNILNTLSMKQTCTYRVRISHPHHTNICFNWIKIDLFKLINCNLRAVSHTRRSKSDWAKWNILHLWYCILRFPRMINIHYSNN